MGYKEELQSNNNALQGNNIDLQSVLNAINELPEEKTLTDLLPTMSNPATAEQVLQGYQSVGADGNVIEGSMVEKEIPQFYASSYDSSWPTYVPHHLYVVSSIDWTDVETKTLANGKTATAHYVPYADNSSANAIRPSLHSKIHYMMFLVQMPNSRRCYFNGLKYDDEGANEVTVEPIPGLRVTASIEINTTEGPYWGVKVTYQNNTGSSISYYSWRQQRTALFAIMGK